MSKLLPIFIALFLITFASFAIADANLDIVMSSTTIFGNPNAAVSGSFIINNTNATTTMTNFNCTVTVGSWTYSCTPPVSIASNQSASTGFSVNIPQYTSPGSYSGSIVVTGNLSGTNATDTQAFNVDVAVAPAYSIVWLTSPSNIYQSQNQTVSYNITNTGNVALTTSYVLNLGALNDPSVNESKGSINPQASFTGTTTLLTDDDTYMGPKTITLTVIGIYNTTLNISISSAKTFDVIYPYCEDIELKTLNTTPIKIDEIKNENDIEDEDFDPLDEIEIDVKIKNSDDDDRISTIVEVVLVFEDGEVDDADDKVKVKIDDDDTETVTLTITVPADIEEGQHYLYLKVTNDEDEDNCQQKVLPLEIVKKNREVVPTSIDFPSEVNCGDTVTFNGKVVNIGENDEEKVEVTFKAFGEIFDEIYDDLDEGDYSSLFSFDFIVPLDAVGTKKMTLRADYDYDDDDETYDESETFGFTTKVVCSALTADKTFTTETSVAIVGEESTVRVLLGNPSTSSRAYSLSASADWAEVSSISPSSVVLSGGEERYITMTIKPNKGTDAGTYNLEFKASYAGTTEAINIPVTIQKSSKEGVFSKFANQYKDNTAWAILNTLLVLAIFAVLVLILTGKHKPNFSALLNKLRKVHK